VALRAAISQWLARDYTEHEQGTVISDSRSLFNVMCLAEVHAAAAGLTSSKRDHKILKLRDMVTQQEDDDDASNWRAQQRRAHLCTQLGAGEPKHLFPRSLEQAQQWPFYLVVRGEADVRTVQRCGRGGQPA
jgi:hypothetical protein